jgi:5'(3')-deoxyribonucleotidase
MDSTIADFYFGVLDAHARETGEVLPPDTVKTWDYEFGPGRHMSHYFSQPGFFRGLNPVPGAERALKGLYDQGHDIVIVSATTTPHAPAEKLEWLSMHYPWLSRRNVIFTGRKELIVGDVLIDDYAGNTRPYLTRHPGALVLGIEYPYNVMERDAFSHLVPSYLDFRFAWARISDLIQARAKL